MHLQEQKHEHDYKEIFETKLEIFSSLHSPRGLHGGGSGSEYLSISGHNRFPL
jgi:hypothetical protein